MVVSLVSTALAAGALMSSAPESLDPQLELFRPFIGKTWKGTFANSTPEKPMIDVARYERAMNGKAVRVMHSVNNGDYGGETLIYWNAEAKKIAYFYLTTAGFRTEGFLTPEKDGFSALEEVKGNANGITQVRSTSKMTGPGKYKVVAEYLQDGKWVPGRETDYVEDSKAKVIFK